MIMYDLEWFTEQIRKTLFIRYPLTAPAIGKHWPVAEVELKIDEFVESVVRHHMRGKDEFWLNAELEYARGEAERLLAYVDIGGYYSVESYA